MTPSGSPGRRRSLAIAATVVAVLGAGAGYLLAGPSGPRYEKRGVLHVIREGATVYTFDAAWRVETLRDLDPGTGRCTVVKSPDPALTSRLRARLLERLEVQGLEQIPAEGKVELDAIRTLGYF